MVFPIMTRPAKRAMDRRGILPHRAGGLPPSLIEQPYGHKARAEQIPIDNSPTIHLTVSELQGDFAAEILHGRVPGRKKFCTSAFRISRNPIPKGGADSYGPAPENWPINNWKNPIS